MVQIDVIGVEAFQEAALVPVDDAHAVRRVADDLDGAVVADDPPQARLERLGNGVHAAHGLKERWILVEELAEVELVLPELRAQQLAEVQRIIDVAATEETGVDLLTLVPAAARAGVEIVGVQAAELDQHGEQPLLVVGGQLVVQCVAVDGLGQQLGDVAALIGHHPPSHHGLAAKSLGVVEEGAAVVVGEHLQLDAELLAIAQDDAVVIGNARRSEIGVEMVLVVEVDPLPAVDLVDHVARAGGQVAAAGAAGGFEDGAVIAGLG